MAFCYNKSLQEVSYLLLYFIVHIVTVMEFLLSCFLVIFAVSNQGKHAASTGTICLL